jgi:hypothetical protein
MDDHIDRLRRTRGTLAGYLAQSPVGSTVEEHAARRRERLAPRSPE